MHGIFTARPSATRRRLLPTVVLVAFFTLWHTIGVMFGASAATTTTITGTAFKDMNEDGTRQSSEAVFAGHVIYLFDADGAFVASRTTDASGRYAFAGLPQGTYDVTYMRTSWQEVWSEWVPTTTEWVFPDHRVTLEGGTVTADFGWRPITRSTDLSAPITEVVGDQGLVVQSYTDAVPAQEILDYVVANFRVGKEAATARLRFGYGTYDRSSTQIRQSDGVVTHVQTTAYASYERLLSQRGFWTVAHEYGHVVMNYHNYLVHQDISQTWDAYLTARGIDPNDERIGSSRRWMPEEIAAEDYRQLFTSDATSADRHMNLDLPDAWDVDGFEAWARESFLGDTGAVDEPVAEPTPTEDTTTEEPVADEEPVAEPEPVVVEEPVVDEEPAPTLSVVTSKVKGINRAELTWPSGGPTDVLRDGRKIATVDGSTYTDGTVGRGSPSHTYRVCARDTGTCSASVAVQF